jgi:bifunctional non-homologous end joining protein LigD
LVEEAPDGADWLHEIKFDGYRMHARLDRGTVQLLTRNGLDWTQKYPAIASALSLFGARRAYLDGELCGVRPDGTTSFSAIQAASDAGKSDEQVFFLFDLLYLDGETIESAPLIDRKARLQELLATVPPPLQYTDHQIGRGREFYARACELSLEGIVSKRTDAPYMPRVVGQNQVPEQRRVRGRRLWTDPEGSRPSSGHSYWRTTPQTTDWYTPVAQQCRAWATMATPATACRGRNATGCAAATDQPLRVAARSQPGSLGATRDCRRGQISHLDRRQLAAPGDL